MFVQFEMLPKIAQAFDMYDDCEHALSMNRIVRYAFRRYPVSYRSQIIDYFIHFLKWFYLFGFQVTTDEQIHILNIAIRFAVDESDDAYGARFEDFCSTKVFYLVINWIFIFI
jgi:hypothetical protein